MESKKQKNELTKQNRNRVINTENKQWLPEGCEYGDEWNRWGKLRGTNSELSNKWVTGIKYTMWGI